VKRANRAALHETRSRGDVEVAAASVRASGTTQTSPGAGVQLDFIAESLRPLAVPIGELCPAPDNARRHALERDVPALMASLVEHRQQKAAVGKRAYRGLTNVILAGNGMLLAASRLAWTHLAVSWFEGSDDEARRYAIRDNRVAEQSVWSPHALRALQADGVDLAALWSDPVDLAALLGAEAPAPSFEPVADDTLGRLDQLAQRACPTCGRAFGEVSE
jgi:hypothetical protein